MLKQFSHYTFTRTFFNLFEISLQKIYTIRNIVFINTKQFYIPFIEFPLTQPDIIDLGRFSRV
jgi:hypothetical protein